MKGGPEMVSFGTGAPNAALFPFASITATLRFLALLGKRMPRRRELQGRAVDRAEGGQPQCGPPVRPNTRVRGSG